MRTPEADGEAAKVGSQLDELKIGARRGQNVPCHREVMGMSRDTSQLNCNTKEQLLSCCAQLARPPLEHKHEGGISGRQVMQDTNHVIIES
jgi:hypothetical protein